MIGQWVNDQPGVIFQWLQFRSPAGIEPKNPRHADMGERWRMIKVCSNYRVQVVTLVGVPQKKGHFRNWEVSERRCSNLFTFCYPFTQKFVWFTPPSVKKLTSISEPRKMKKSCPASSYQPFLWEEKNPNEPQKRTWLVVPYRGLYYLFTKGL